MGEKIKFQNGAEYELALGRAFFTEETAKLTIVLPDGKSYDDVERDVTGNNRIEILDSSGEIIMARSGYAYLDTLTKKKDYVIGNTQVENGVDEENGEIIYEGQNITGTVMIVTLKKIDVRQELMELRRTVKEQSATIDMILIADLEG